MKACAGALMAGVFSCGVAGAQTLDLPAIDVTSSRLGFGIVGASTTVITAEEIERSPGFTVQDILARQPGIQTWSLFGGVNGAGTTVDMRGFGAAAASNTVVLVNGRRLTDIDIAGVDLSAIPRNSIERIEITRGNSGGVLYGDGAVGGVINIVTRNGVNLPPALRVEGAFGTFRQREGVISANAASGPFSASVAGNAFDSDGYRQNNGLQQRNGVGDFRYTIENGSVYANISVDDQRLGLPGARRVTLTTSELDTDPTGATTPTAFANKQGLNGTLGFTRRFGDGFELIVDGGVRQKKQQAFSSLGGFDTSDARTLTTYSFTPRFIAQSNLFGMPSRTIAGIDFYYATLGANRGALLSDPPAHRYSLTQRPLGVYGQNTISVLPNTDVSFGARLQQTSLSARDIFDPTAPNAFDAEALPLDSIEVQHALHFGIEHRFNAAFTMFGRLARSFRTPNVDERIGVLSFPVDFRLRTQVSQDAEAGIRLRHAGIEVVSSVYDMRLTDEIQFNPSVFANVNLDPTHRYGSETQATWRVDERLTLKGGLAYTRAVFREGPFAGNDVPLVSRWTANVGASWTIVQKQLVLDTVVRYVGARRMDNDQRNFQPLIPAHTLVDVRLGGEVKNLYWSIAVQNLFDKRYFDYAAASASTFGTYNAYPQPGRMILARLGVKLP
jgi:iron complex outermembrane receptor protein